MKYILLLKNYVSNKRLKVNTRTSSLCKFLVYNRYFTFMSCICNSLRTHRYPRIFPYQRDLPTKAICYISDKMYWAKIGAVFQERIGIFRITR